jgi:hypothetical protein
LNEISFFSFPSFANNQKLNLNFFGNSKKFSDCKKPKTKFSILVRCSDLYFQQTHNKFRTFYFLFSLFSEPFQKTKKFNSFLFFQNAFFQPSKQSFQLDQEKGQTSKIFFDLHFHNKKVNSRTDEFYFLFLLFFLQIFLCKTVKIRTYNWQKKSHNYL